MLLRAYIIRLADGLLASGASLSVVTDTSVASCVLFAAAKVYKTKDFGVQPYIR